LRVQHVGHQALAADDRPAGPGQSIPQAIQGGGAA